MPRWIVTIETNLSGDNEEIEIWADHVRQRDSRSILADGVMIVFKDVILKPPRPEDT